MAITNAQQYQQLVNKPANGKRPGYRGDAAYGRSSRSSQATSIGQARGATGPGGGASLGGGRDRNETSVERPDSDLAREQTKRTQEVIARNKTLADIDREQKKKKNLTKFGYKKPKTIFNTINQFSPLGNILNPIGSFLNQKQREMYVDNYADKYDTYEDYLDAITSRFDNKDDGGGGSGQPIIPLMAQAPEEPELDPDSLEGMIANRVAYRFMADGGMTNDAPVEGGIMDLESGRQMYFLGKLVKKATRAVKKIAKSPIGKAALLYAGGSFLGGGGGGLTSIFGKDAFLRKTLLPKLYSGGKMTGLGKIALGGALTAAPLLFQQEEEEPDYASNRGPGLDINAIRSNPYNTMGSSYRFFAEGGDVEPVAKETMPLIDMDGKEMDLRADGGFVPIGRMERADDVPARLSKNEFVFTADAVRNAGEGDIDKGAEVMYNMMKNLESGGEVSEESQGLDGAREMFQTSKRLEEVL